MCLRYRCFVEYDESDDVDHENNCCSQFHCSVVKTKEFSLGSKINSNMFHLFLLTGILMICCNGLADDSPYSTDDEYRGTGVLVNGTNDDGVLDVMIEIYTAFCKVNDPNLADYDPMDVVFTARKRSHYPIKLYLDRIDKLSGCRGVCLIISAIYIDRLIHQQTNIYFSSWSAHRLIIASIVLASKYHNEPRDCYSNKHYAAVGGLSLKELNKLERVFLKYVGFDLYVSPETLQGYICAFEMRIKLSGYLEPSRLI